MRIAIIRLVGTINLGRDGHDALAGAGDVELDGKPILDPGVCVYVKIDLVAWKILSHVQTRQKGLESDRKTGGLAQSIFPIGIGYDDLLVIQPFDLCG